MLFLFVLFINHELYIGQSDEYYIIWQLIPTEFMERIMEDEEEDGSALLVCSNGEEWRVTIVEENNFWFFKRGWNTFVEENLIGEMDAMLFTYAGSMKFNVKFFLPNGLKKPTEGGVCGYSVVSPHTTQKRPRFEPESMVFEFLLI